MGKKLLGLFFLAAGVVGIVILLGIELEKPTASKITLREFTTLEKYQLHLYQKVLESGLSYRDYRILKEVIKCESNWRQYKDDGQLIVSSGNIGLGQINKFAHETTYKSLGFNPEDPYDNLNFTVYLYKRDGLNPWQKWSGACWLPKISNFYVKR